VPGMGMHAVPAADLRSATAFEKDMIVGYYHARPIFLEPMISRATLLERRSFSLEVPSVPGAPAGVGAPTAFRAVYDRGAQAYRFAFAGLR